MPKSIWPFATTFVLMVVAVLVSFLSLRRLDKSITTLGVNSTDKAQLVRSANWYSDSTQALAILAPPVVGLGLGAASGSGWLVAIYLAVIIVTFVTLLTFGFSDPLDYGKRLKPECPITRLSLIGLVVNGVALVVTWIIAVKGHSAG
jgi:hypothetical protein